ncbi:T9SS type A sorting domain-containing protein [Ferruginibacter paludis]|uniref:T9SS type A sorting domain-containing protein n=1 Tax=Ferruginibacter paludis TaxID=1310417 RepID=UPI0025B51DC1|nr:T9SS type A sorting domain-containing protein [Ferruginibacter paludis]MDN3658917.1 T9SS type A sorting domain-containing protein [Ferruginibacter paludis]
MQTHLPLILPHRGGNLATPASSVSFYNQRTNKNQSSELFKQKHFLWPFKLRATLLICFIVVFFQYAGAQTTYTWNGNTSSDWFTKTNWTPSTNYPTITDSVIFPNGPRYPILTVDAYCARIVSIADGATISGAAALHIGSVSTTATSGMAEISCPLVLGADVTFAPASGASFKISGIVSGTGGLFKSDLGILNLVPTSANLSSMEISGGYTYLGSGVTISGGINLDGGNLNLGSGTLYANGIIALNSGILNLSSGTLYANAGITRTAGFLAGNASSKLILGGSNSETLYFAAGQETLNTLTLSHAGTVTTTLFTKLTIYNGIIFGSSSDNLDLNGQSLILNSDISGTAYMGEIKGTLTNATNVSVQRYMDRNQYSVGSRGWRLLSIPVTGQTIRQAWAGANANPSAPTGESQGYGTLITGHGYADGNLAAAAGYDWFTGLGTNTTSSIRYYTASKAWASATNTPSTLTVPDKQGYMLYVRGDRTVATVTDSGYATLNPTGTLKQGTQTIPVNDTYTVIGNPYACPIDLESVYNNSGNSAVINHNFWIWDATLGTSGGYRSLTWNSSSYDMTGGSGNVADYLVVNSGQAFFVEKNNTGSITISESNKSTATPASVFRPMGSTGVSKIGVKLYQATGSTLGTESDGVLARYNDIYSVSPFETYDAPKLNNFNENLSLVRSGRYLSIESRPFPTSNDTLFMPFWGLTKRDYALTVTSSLFTGLNQSASLFDAFTNTRKLIDMNGGTIIYPFSITNDPASSSLNRFIIIMAPAQSGVLPVTFTRINAIPRGSDIQIEWSNASEAGILKYDIEKSTDGIHFSKINSVQAMNAAKGGNYIVTDNAPVKGNNFYRIKSNDESGKMYYSGIAVVQLNGKKGIQVTPTLINNQQFTIALNGATAGDYNIALTNLSGQQVFSTTISNAGGNSARVIRFQKAVSAGIYHLTVTGNDGSLQNFRVLIKN